MARTKKTDHGFGETKTAEVNPAHCQVCGAVFGSCDHTKPQQPENLPATIVAQQIAETLQQRRTDYPPALAARRVALMRSIQPINKADLNEFHKYHYASANDVCDGVRSLMLDQGVFLDQEETGKKSMNDGVLTIEYAFTWSDMDGNRGPAMLWSGMCRLVDSKGTADDKAAPKAHTQARKYFLIKNLDISTPDMPDSDADKVPDGVKGTTRAPADNIPAEPHLILADPGTPQNWQRLYLIAIRRAATAAEVMAWVQVNQPQMKKLKEKAEPLYVGASEAVMKRLGELAAQSAPAQEGQNRRPLPPRADGQENPTQGQAGSSAPSASAQAQPTTDAKSAAAAQQDNRGQFGPQEEQTMLEGWGVTLAACSTKAEVMKARTDTLGKIEAKLSGVGSSKAIFMYMQRLKQVEAGAISEDAWDFESWFKTDLLGALSSCEEGDIEGLDRVRQKVVNPARGRMTEEQWRQVTKKYREEAARIKGDEL